MKAEENKPSHLLIVDDDVDVATLFQSYFESEGYRVSIAHDVRAALDVDESDPADAVITDYAMPQANGVELEKQLRGRRPDVPVIIVSGYARDVMVGNSSLTAVITKPVNLAMLSQRVLQMLARTRH